MAINTPKPISRDERYLSKIGGDEKVIVPKPVSREEKYMYRAAGYDDQPIPDYPIGRNEKYWAKIVENGGGSSTLIEKSITENGIYNASDDEADGYSKVTVNVVGDYNAKFISLAQFTLAGNLQEIIIPEGVIEIGTNCFFRCIYLTKLVLPQSLTKLNRNSIRECNRLTTITIPSGVTTIGGMTVGTTDAFNGNTNLTKIIVEQNEQTSPIAQFAPWGAKNAQIIWTG